MKFKLFIQIILLSVIAGAVIFLTLPRYHFMLKDEYVFRANKITGKVEVYPLSLSQGYTNWITLKEVEIPRKKP